MRYPGAFFPASSPHCRQEDAVGLFDWLFGPPSKDKFARVFLEGIRRAGETAKVVYDPEQYRLVAEGGEFHVVFLGNAYQEYCSVQRAARPRILQKWVRNWFAHLKELPKAFEDVHPDLLPSIRPRSYFEMTRLQLQVDGQKAVQWPHQVLGEHFAVGLVYDLPESMQWIGQEDLDRWGVTFYEALEAARENLAKLPVSFLGPEEGEGLYLSAVKDNYDASRLLLPDLVRQFRARGDVVAMIPSRDDLFVAGSQDTPSLAAMAALAQESLQGPRPMLGIALRLEGDDWIAWLPETSHPLHNQFRKLYVHSVGQDYADQKDLLDKLHEKTHQDVFVASCMELENKDTGNVATLAVWTEGVATLLPRTDLVGLASRSGQTKVAPWERVREVLGDIMEPLDLYPERYRVQGFPTAQQLAAMGAEDGPP
jgi:hypothetical protein